MTLTKKPLSDCIPLIEPMILNIEKVWLERGGGPGVRIGIDKKVKEIEKGQVDGIMVFDKNEPAGFGWVEKTTPNYGNMFVHCYKEKNKAPLINLLLDTIPIGTALLELIQFYDDISGFRQAMLDRKLIENERQRMVLFLDDRPIEPEMPPYLSLEYNSETQLDTIGHISCEAHKVSKDYEGYKDLETGKNRAGLEQQVINGLYGKFIQNASPILLYNNEPIGYCSVVDITCWGYEKVPWIFDIVLLPKYQGQGFGRLLFEKVNTILYDMGYPIVGLAVSLSNHSAVHLYRSMGFELVEIFYEYAHPDNFNK